MFNPNKNRVDGSFFGQMPTEIMNDIHSSLPSKDLVEEANIIISVEPVVTTEKKLTMQHPRRFNSRERKSDKILNNSSVNVEYSKASPFSEDDIDNKDLISISGVNIYEIENSLEENKGVKEQMSITDPRKLEFAEESARQKSIRMMNAIRVISPAIGLALKSSNSEQEQAKNFSKMMSQAQKQSVSLLNKMGVNSEDNSARWMINVAERALVEGCWSADQKTLECSEELIEEVAKSLEYCRFDKSDFIKIGSEYQVKLAILSAVSQFLLSQHKFDFFRDRNTDINWVSKYLIDLSLKSVRELSDDMATKESLLILFQTLMSEFGRAWSVCWDVESNKYTDLIAKQSKVEFETFMSANPNGLPIENVINGFDNYVRRIKSILKSKG